MFIPVRRHFIKLSLIFSICRIEGRKRILKIGLERAFALVLRECREEAGYTQEKLAEEASFDRTYISLLERSKRMPRLPSLFQLCKALDVGVSEFISRIESRMKHG